MKKRILSLVLALTFALALVPLAIAAEISPHPHTTVPRFPHDEDVINFSIDSLTKGDYTYFTIDSAETGLMQFWTFNDSNTYKSYSVSKIYKMLNFNDGWSYMIYYDGQTSKSFSSEINYYSLVEYADGTAYEFFKDGCFRQIFPDGTVINYDKDYNMEIVNPSEPEQAPAPVPEPTPIPEPAPTPAPAPVPVPSVLTAAPNASTIMVDGKVVAFDAYTIDSENYIKLRDVAYTLNGTRVQFDVSYDGMINITSGTAYTPDGSEMKSKGTSNKTPVLNKAKIMLNGKEVELTAYTIDGNNYFKLRELAITFNFRVGWDGASSTITINTNETYTP